MDIKEIKSGDRLYHPSFGWCEVIMSDAENNILVNLEADAYEFYPNSTERECEGGFVTIAHKRKGYLGKVTKPEYLFKNDNYSPEHDAIKLNQGFVQLYKFIQ